ncbi:MAG: efflux RND transporter permease subunit [Bacillus sp. (in: firmicutes)]
MKLSAFSIRRPIFTLVSMVFILVLGAVSVFNIPLKLIPDINPPVAVVVTSYEGASPTEVSEKVAKPLESSLSTVQGLKNITSTSQEGANLILLEFSWTTSLDEVENDILQKIDSTSLPSDVGNPRFMKFDPTQFPVIQLTLSSDTNPDTLQQLAEQLERQLTKVDGIASINLSGTSIEQVQIELNEEKLKTYSLSQGDVVNTIAANNVSLPGEKVLTEGKQLTTRIFSSLQSQEEIGQLTLMVDPVTQDSITIADVGEISTVKQDDTTITRANEQPAVLLSILQQSDANTADVSKNFQQELKSIMEEETYKDIEYDVLFDQGDYIQLAINNISSTLVIGAALAMAVLFLFLRSVKSPIIVGISIPYSVIVTFVLMYFSNFTLNILTLGGLALGVGMLVDNSIVVIENIYRHLSMGKKPKVAAADGTKEVGGAIAASTLTTVVVFLPVAFISGIIGDLFTEFALTISFSLFASLFVALTVVPMLASRWLKEPPVNKEEIRKTSRSMTMLRKSVKWALFHRWTVLFITLLLIGVSTYGVTKVGTEFLPSTDEGYFSINVELENGTPLTETEKVVAALEKELHKVKEIDVYVSFIGSSQSNSFSGAAEGNTAEIYVKLTDLEQRDRSVFEIADEIKAEIEKEAKSVNESANVSIVQQSSQGTSPNTLTFNLRDSDSERLNENVDKLQNELTALNDITEVETDLSDQVEEVLITVDREKALQHGFVPSQVATITNDVTRGSFATQLVTESGEVQSVIVQYDQRVVENIDSLKQLAIRKADGSFIELQEVANFSIGESPVKIQRINNQDAVQFTVKYKSSTNLGDITEKVENIADQALSKETQLVYSGEKDLLDTTLNQMVLAFILAIVFIYLVMAAQFESLKYPFVIMFSVPLFVIGVGISLYFTKTPIGLTSLIGIIMLAGIVVNNAIVLVEYINQRKEQGISTYEAIISSVEDRARPILMTALTTILGLIPLALGIGEGTEIMQPMGIAVIGGLISSTFLTIFIIPIIYSFFDRQTRKKSKLKKASRHVSGSPKEHLINKDLAELENLLHRDSN